MCAFFISNNLRKTFEFISNIRLVPMREAKLLENIPDENLTFILDDDLDGYDFMLQDRVTDIYQKYF